MTLFNSLNWQFCTLLALSFFSTINAHTPQIIIPPDSTFFPYKTGSTTLLLTDPSGIASYTLSLNSKDITRKAAVTYETPSRDTVRLSLDIDLPLDINTLIITATSNSGETAKKVEQIKKEKNGSAAQQNFLRRLLYHILKRLF